MKGRRWKPVKGSRYWSRRRTRVGGWDLCRGVRDRADVGGLWDYWVLGNEDPIPPRSSVFDSFPDFFSVDRTGLPFLVVYDLVLLQLGPFPGSWVLSSVWWSQTDSPS